VLWRARRTALLEPVDANIVPLTRKYDNEIRGSDGIYKYFGDEGVFGCRAGSRPKEPTHTNNSVCTHSRAAGRKSADRLRGNNSGTCRDVILGIRGAFVLCPSECIKVSLAVTQNAQRQSRQWMCCNKRFFAYVVHLGNRASTQGQLRQSGRILFASPSF
jgi:hypothetical protein